MKSVTSVVGWAIAVAAVGAAIWWLLDRDESAGRWLLGGLLVAHGLVHVLFAVPVSEATGSDWPFDITRSWTITGLDLTTGIVNAIGWVLIGLVIAGFGLAGLSTVGIVVPSGWWHPTVVAGVAATIIALIVFFNPQLVLGSGINAALVWVALGGGWSP